MSLENVKSYGTEGRKGKPEEEIAPADQVYDYIVFRGTDVKDLRIEDGNSAPPAGPPVPNDPAILGVSFLRSAFLPLLSLSPLPRDAFMMNHFRMKNIYLSELRKQTPC